MFIIGLTGSIGMGKTWGSKCLRHFGVPVHDADACVHQLMARNGAATQHVERIFPGVLTDHGDVDRFKLAQKVFGDDQALDRLEHTLHPLVQNAQRHFLQCCQRRGVCLAALDIPLLYETGGHHRVDAVMVMSAANLIQRQRVMRRAGMSAQKFKAILARQIDNTIKCRLADFVVTTGATHGQSLRAIAKIVKVIKSQKGQVWTPRWGYSSFQADQ